jgi:hypothetical protein
LSNEEHYVALPKLMGAPAYARPPRLYDPSPRNPDLDDLPIEAFRTDEDLAIVVADPAAAQSPGNGSTGGAADSGRRTEASLQARPFSLKSLSRFLAGKD